MRESQDTSPQRRCPFPKERPDKLVCANRYCYRCLIYMWSLFNSHTGVYSLIFISFRFIFSQFRVRKTGGETGVRRRAGRGGPKVGRILCTATPPRSRAGPVLTPPALPPSLPLVVCTFEGRHPGATPTPARSEGQQVRVLDERLPPPGTRRRDGRHLDPSR